MNPRNELSSVNSLNTETREEEKRREIHQTILGQFGEVLAGIIAFGCGVTVAAAFITLGSLAPGILAYSIAGILFSAVTYVNWLIYKNSVPEVLVEMFGKKILFERFRVDSENKPLSPEKKFLLGLGFVVSLAAGIAQAALTINSALILPKGLAFLGVLGSGFFPPLAIILGIVTVFCVTAMILKRILELVNDPKVLDIDNCKAYLKNLFNFTSPQELRAKITVVSSLTPEAFDSTLDSDVDMHYYFLKGENGIDDSVLYCARKDGRGNITHELIKLNKPKIVSPGLIELYNKLRNTPCYVSKPTASDSTITLGIPPKLSNDQQLSATQKDQLSKEQNLLSELVRFDNHPEPKSRFRINSEKGLTIVLTFILLPLAVIGLIMTMKTSAAGLQTLMLKIPSISKVVVDVFANGLVWALAVLGRIVFTCRNTLRIIPNMVQGMIAILQGIAQLFSRHLLGQNNNTKEQKVLSSQQITSPAPSDIVSRIGDYVLSLINAAGNGLISLKGALAMGFGSVFGWLADIGGAWVSFSTAVSSGILDGASPEKKMLVFIDPPVDSKLPTSNEESKKNEQVAPELSPRINQSEKELEDAPPPVSSRAISSYSL